MRCYLFLVDCGGSIMVLALQLSFTMILLCLEKE